jgi:hypothetical protein
MKNLGKQIVVIDNGFVHVGECSSDGEFLRIDNARNIRVWGTQHGLGQLRSGPAKETKHDVLGTVLVPSGRVIFYIALSEDSKW